MADSCTRRGQNFTSLNEKNRSLDAKLCETHTPILTHSVVQEKL